MPLDEFMPAIGPALDAMEVSPTRTDRGAELVLSDGRLIVEAAPEGCRLSLEAAEGARLAFLREVISHYVEAMQLPVPLEWAADRSETRPANLTIARIAANERLSPSFQRIRLEGDFSLFARDGLHFRLIFGPEGADWPTSNATGTTLWDGGIDAWHRPPYTVRAIAPDHRWIDVDIVLHDGGRITDWVSRARPGDEVALTGPGGKAPQMAGWVGYVGDETALPVIARIVERLPGDARGAVRLFVPDARDRQPLAAPDGVDLQWLVHGRDGTPLQALQALRPPARDRYVFFAGERQASIAAREYLVAEGFQRGEYHAAAYWTEGWVPPDTQVRRLC